MKNTLKREVKFQKGICPLTVKGAVPDINRVPIENGVDRQNGGKNA